MLFLFDENHGKYGTKSPIPTFCTKKTPTVVTIAVAKPDDNLHLPSFQRYLYNKHVYYICFIEQKEGLINTQT
jgi:hypothetical protein